MVEHNLSVVADLCRHDHRAAARQDSGRGQLRGGLGAIPRVIEAYMGGDDACRGDGERCCRCADLHAWYGEIARAARHRLRGARRRVRDPARPQRRRQDHHAAVDHGHRARGAGLDPLRTAASSIGLPRRRDRPARHRLLSGGARHLRQPHGRGEPVLPPVVARRAACVDEIFELFPNLARAAAAARAPSSRAASSRCSRSPASCAPARSFCCSTSRPKASRRSS